MAVSVWGGEEWEGRDSHGVLSGGKTAASELTLQKLNFFYAKQSRGDSAFP